MKLDLTSFAFGFSINGSNGNPNWATALGQGAQYKINRSDSINEILKGVIYCSVPLSLVQAKIGKGGRTYRGTDPNGGIVLGGLFEKVYANGSLVPNCKLVVILTRDTTQTHEGRLRLKYSPHNAVLNADGEVDISNENQFDKIRDALGLSADACWFVYEINVIDQDQLHLAVGVADANDNVLYHSRDDLHAKWNEIIVSAGGTPTPLSGNDGVYQLIAYGAPGTGKSHRTKLETEGHAVYRTTFHPDSDYSTFVGAYKPTMRSEQRINCIDDKAKAVNDANGKPSMQDVIAYTFVPQAFLKAYVDAWRKMAQPMDGRVEPVYLVIEEINRGNCAQIFGDLFQLLDRDGEGYSDYPIDADDDLRRYLAEAFGGMAAGGGVTGGGGRGATAILEEVASGAKLMLPPNLYIRATMNTSDQSLFPIDSAFKRRWDWEYTPIRDCGKGWVVKVGDARYDWWSFLEKINEVVFEETLSADKQMGYFFVKLPEGQTEIDSKKFVNKVAFYLWNDLFKDCEFRGDALKLKDANGQPGGPITFADFFKPHSDEVNEKVVKDLFEGLGVAKAEGAAEEEVPSAAAEGA